MPCAVAHAILFSKPVVMAATGTIKAIFVYCRLPYDFIETDSAYMQKEFYN
ncbi:hypothetical protein U0035_21315 [Niabella yanshanensis]|uniref:Uncharacterized protein n=1 Tax=Niabella yanshanensis TaxID=577386 RepID=A0ABZ0W4N0_9BACT|nr:hypothetical protein [Niabella yanshanensis]WQD38213.1 hypothetical protein U0035_21315 [Niabella yanshanensis]